MNIDRYKMNGIEFAGDSWEFVHSLVYLKYGKKINILELGEGNYSLIFAISGELFDLIRKILSVDMKNKYSKGEKEFYEKKRIFSAISNRGYEYVEHFQGDCLADDVLRVARALFIDDPIDLFIVEYMNNDEYMDSVLNAYEFFLSDNVDIYYHNLNKSKESQAYFDKISSGKRSVLLDAGPGVGIIKMNE